MGSAEEEEAGAELELGLELEVAGVDEEGSPPGWLEEAAGPLGEETSDGEGDPDKEESTGLLPWPQAKSNVDIHKVSNARFLFVFMPPFSHKKRRETSLFSYLGKEIDQVDGAP